MTRFLVPLLFLSLVGCGSSNSTDDQSPHPGLDHSISVTTWNVGLAYGYVDFAEERQSAIVQALAGLDSDVVCLQEVWTEDDQVAVQAKLEASGYRVHIYQTDGGGVTGGCSEEEAEPLKNCVYDNQCDEVPQDELVDCVTGKCGEQLAEVSSGCTGCLVQNLSLPVDEIMLQCIGVSGTGAFSYGGHNGLVLASKTPLESVEEVDFDASLTFRSYIKATVPAHNVDVVCTHLTASLSAPYTGAYSGYEEEQAQQIDQMLNALSTSTRTILMGDMNTGPTNTDAGTVSELPANYEKFTDAGWTSHTLETCTWCPDGNTLIGSGPDRTIDHIMTSSDWPSNTMASAVRNYDGVVSIQDENGVDMEVNLSDHFGMTATISWSDE